MVGSDRLHVLSTPSAWKTFFAIVVFAVMSVLPGKTEAAELVSPHDEERPKVCLNCHTEEVYAKICDEKEGYCLLAGSVDGLCMTCHIKEECCKPALRHLPKLHLGIRNHPSNIAAQEIPRKYLPRTLPLFQNRISCRTCHLHRRERPDGYKMLRLVKSNAQGVDWTPLCHDCHKDR